MAELESFDHIVTTHRVQPSNILRNDYLRNCNAALHDIRSAVKFDKTKFQANFHVQSFNSGGICVKVSGDNEKTIEGKKKKQELKLINFINK